MLVAIFAMASLAWTSCSKYDDDIAYLQDQIDSNTAAIEANAAAIASIESLISSGAVITNVTSTSSGIMIYMSDGTSYEITNGVDGQDGADGEDGEDGKDGADGADGADGETGATGSTGATGATGEKGEKGDAGSVITIGSDGYWYIDGEKTEFKAQDGEDGDDGADGEDGTNGDYYVPNPTTGYFDLYTYNTETGKYESTQTDIVYASGLTAIYDAESGVVTLVGLVDENGDTYSVTLGLSSIANLYFIPELIDAGVQAFAVSVMEDAVYTASTTYVLSATSQVNYRVNPTNYVVGDDVWSMVARSVETRATGDAAIFGVAYDANSETGVATLDVKALPGAYYTFESGLAENERIIATAQVIPEGSNGTISSDYAYVATDVYYPGINVEVDAVDDMILVNETIPDVDAAADIIVYFDRDDTGVFTKTIDLDDIVAAYASADYTVENGGIFKPFASYGFDKDEVYFTFENFEYLATAGDKDTDQSYFVTINDDNWLLPAQTTSMVNRTPVVKVQMKTVADDNTIAQGYIKFKVLDKEDEPIVQGNVLVDIYDNGVLISTLETAFNPTVNTVDDTMDRFEFDYADLFGESSTDLPGYMDILWKDMTDVLETLQVSNQEYVNIYGEGVNAPNSYVEVSSGTASVAYDFTHTPYATDVDMSTHVHAYAINYLMEWGDDESYFTITPEDPNFPVVTYRFNYTVNEVYYAPTILNNYKVSDAVNATGAAYEVDVVEVDGQIITRAANGEGSWYYGSYECVDYGDYYWHSTPNEKDLDQAISANFPSKDLIKADGDEYTVTVTISKYVDSAKYGEKPNWIEYQFKYEVTYVADIPTTTTTGFEMSTFIGEIFNRGNETETDVTSTFRDNFAGAFTGSDAWAEGEINLATFGLTDSYATANILTYELGEGNDFYTDVTMSTPRGYYYDDLNTVIGVTGSDEQDGLLIKLGAIATDYVDVPMTFTTKYPNGETNDFDFVIRFVNPLAMTAPAYISFTDYIEPQEDTQDVSVLFDAKILTRTVFTEGKLVYTGDYYGDLTDADYGLFYNLESSSTLYYTFYKNSGVNGDKDGNFTWSRGTGTNLTEKTEVGAISASFVTPFASISTVDIPVYVVPEVVE